MRGIILILVLITCLSFKVQSNLNEGVYEYKSGNFYESIKLNANYKFEYSYRLNPISYSLEGNYRIKGDSLILDSSPQRDKIIVRESKKGNKRNFRFCVADKLGVPFNYTLYAITKENDTITLANQWENSKIKNTAIRSFYIVDSKGLKTPTYLIQGTNTNHFEIIMETKRVMDNEVWKIKEDIITPIGNNGEYQPYTLKKVTN